MGENIQGKIRQKMKRTKLNKKEQKRKKESKEESETSFPRISWDKQFSSEYRANFMTS